MPQFTKYSRAGVVELIKNMREIFEVARLVDVSMTHQLDLNEDGTDLVETNYDCYAVWNKEHRCENCVSAMAFQVKGKMTKFEFVEGNVYYVVSKYVEVEDTPYMMEMVTKIDDNTLFGAYGKEEFIQTIIGYNTTLYMDPLTKAYNRHYYDSQLKNLSRVNAIAMVDVDHFKEVNDTYGHDAGDMVLKAIVDTIKSKVRPSDTIIRYGGDEFMVLFEYIPAEKLAARIEDIRASVEAIVIRDYPDIRTSVSIGAAPCEVANKASIMKADNMLYKAKQKRNCAVC